MSALADGRSSPWPRLVRDLLPRMTLEEKVAQISATVLTAVDGPPPATGVGTVYVPSSLPDGAARLAAFREATADDGHGIPVLALALGPDLDPPLPPRLGRVATWDVRLAEQMAAATARAQRAAGLHGQLVSAGSGGPSPDGLAGRALEPLLAATFVAARVHGAQGASTGWATPIDADHVAVLASIGVWPDGQWHERVLRGRTLVAVEAAVRAGAAGVVPTPAANAGVPTHTDGWLLRDVLRREWRFGGAVLAHPGAIDALHETYRIAGGPDQAVALALEAGVDVVGTAARMDGLVALVRNGAVSSWLVDDAVSAVLALKLRLGLVGPAVPGRRPRAGGGPAADRPPPGASPPVGSAADDATARLARTAFARSTVLLTDPAGVLPLTGARIVDVVPVAAGSPDVDALARALAAALPAATVRAGAPDGAAAPADTVVVITARPEDAVRTAAVAVAAGRGCVVAVTGDRLSALDVLAATTATVLLCWHPLAGHADVLADVLTGRAEPGGRLPLTVPAGPDGNASFPLGHGNGYTTFDYSRLGISPSVLDGGDVLRVRCWVTNTGPRPGREVVQVYLANPTGRSVVTDGPTLAAFCTVEPGPGQTLPATLRLPLTRLAVWNRSMHRILEPGTVDVLVGRSAADIRLRGTVTIQAHPSHWRT